MLPQWCHLAGSRPWHKHTRHHPAQAPPALDTMGACIFLEHCTDMPNPMSFQLRPSSDVIVLGKQNGKEGIFVRGLYISLLECIKNVCPARKLEAWALFDRKYAGRGGSSGKGKCHWACSNGTNHNNIQNSKSLLHISTYYYLLSPVIICNNM